ncbi:MAG: hypothetical protein ACI9GM_000038 [Salibacteraceae bacterium]|jgi:photosystem II stability/assembly factor-like uncharacterized protein
MRISIILCLCSGIFFYSCQTITAEKKAPIIEITDFSFTGITIRAIEVLDDSTVWFAGSKGVWGYTLDNGVNWYIDTLKMENATLELRSIKITPNGHVFLVNTTSPACIFKSVDNGANWKMVYTDTNQGAFFDAVNFWDNANGILLGDAVDDCFHFARTSNNGETWSRISCDAIPAPALNENPFAASNTNIALGSTSVWIPMGGKSPSRVYYSHNLGLNWSTAFTPIIAGETMTGIFSTDFLNDSIGVIAGGNWEDVTFKCHNMAITKDGGASWSTLPNIGNSGYISAIQWIPETNGERLITMSGRGREGYSAIGIYDFKINKWTLFANPKNYLAIQCASKKIAWVSGKDWIGRMQISN